MIFSQNAGSGRQREGASLPRRRSPWISSFAMILPSLILLMIFYFYPIEKLLPQSIYEDHAFTLQYFQHIFSEPVYIKTLLRTIWLCLATTAINFILGYPVAYLLSIVKSKTAGAIMTIILLSLWTSLLVRTYSWMVILQRTGVVNSFLLALGIVSEPVQIMYTPAAVLIGMVHILLPYMILPIYSVLRSIDKNLSLAAMSLGRFQDESLPARHPAAECPLGSPPGFYWYSSSRSVSTSPPCFSAARRRWSPQGSSTGRCLRSWIGRSAPPSA